MYNSRNWKPLIRFDAALPKNLEMWSAPHVLMNFNPIHKRTAIGLHGSPHWEVPSGDVAEPAQGRDLGQWLCTLWQHLPHRIHSGSVSECRRKACYSWTLPDGTCAAGQCRPAASSGACRPATLGPSVCWQYGPSVCWEIIEVACWVKTLPLPPPWRFDL